MFVNSKNRKRIEYMIFIDSQIDINFEDVKRKKENKFLYMHFRKDNSKYIFHKSQWRNTTATPRSLGVRVPIRGDTRWWWWTATSPGTSSVRWTSSDSTMTTLSGKSFIGRSNPYKCNYPDFFLKDVLTYLFMIFQAI